MTFRPALPSAHDLPALWAEDFGGGRVAKDAAPIFDVAGICQLRIFTRKGSVRAARKRIAKPAQKETKPENDDEFRRRKLHAQFQNRDFLLAIRRAAR